MRRAWTIAIASLLLGAPAFSQGDPRRISPAESAVADRRVALVVGNSSYPEAPLRNPGNDARAVAAALQRLNFQVAVALDVTRRQLDEATEKFASDLKAGDLALFYYSGHGAQLNAENYLIPVDFQGSSASDLRYNGFPASQIRDRLEESSARVRVMILDACRDNPFRGVRGGAGGLASMTSPAVGTLIAYATAENSTADDNRGEAYGLYTKHLLDALNTPGLSLKQVFQQARDNVWTQGGRKQLPYVYDGIVGDVMLTGGVATAPAPAPAAAPDPASLAWERAKDSHNRAMLEAMIREFPDSPYARLARVELAGMAPEPKIPSQPVFDANATFARAQQLFNAKNYSAALPLLRQCADAGKSDAMHLMGWFYQNGFGVAQDYHAALDWYRKGAESGNALSMNNIGFFYQNGQGVAQDYGTAMQWYRRSADLGFSGAMNSLGYMYEAGQGAAPNRTEALSWYQKASNQGDANGAQNLARLSALPPPAAKPAPNVPPIRPAVQPTLPAQPPQGGWPSASIGVYVSGIKGCQGTLKIGEGRVTFTPAADVPNCRSQAFDVPVDQIVSFGRPIMDKIAIANMGPFDLYVNVRTPVAAKIKLDYSSMDENERDSFLKVLSALRRRK